MFRGGGRDTVCPWAGTPQKRGAKGVGRVGRTAPEVEGIRGKARHYGQRPEQLFEDRPGCHLHADEG